MSLQLRTLRDSKPFVIGFSATIVCLVAFGGAYLLAKAPETAAPPSPSASYQEAQLHMLVDKSGFQPNVLYKDASHEATLDITATDGAYGFRLPALGMDLRIGTGQTVRVVLPPAAPGVLPFWDPLHSPNGAWSTDSLLRGNIVVVQHP